MLAWKQAWAEIRIHKGLYGGMVILWGIVAACWVVVGTLDVWLSPSQDARDNPVTVILFAQRAEDAEPGSACMQRLQALPEVSSAALLSPEAVIKRLDLPPIAELPGGTSTSWPLPPLVEVQLVSHLGAEALQALEQAWTQDPCWKTVISDRETWQEWAHWQRVIAMGGKAIVGLMWLLVNYTMVYHMAWRIRDQHEALSVMVLLGADPAYMYRPLVYCGLGLGLVSGILGIAGGYGLLMAGHDIVAPLVAWYHMPGFHWHYWAIASLQVVGWTTVLATGTAWMATRWALRRLDP